VFVITAEIDRCECATALVVEGDDEKWQRSWREEKNARGKRSYS
jgi:hypothetical protein